VTEPAAAPPAPPSPAPPPDRQDAASRAFWDGVAASDARGHLHGLLEQDRAVAEFRDRAEKGILLRRLPELSRARRVLEVGCGGGRWTVELAGLCERILAVDISAGMVERARAAVAAAGRRNADVQVAAFHDVPEGGPFDLVYLGSCLHYIDDAHIEAGLARLDALVAPGAILLSRDTVSLTGRAFHRAERYGGDDPAIYRPADAYREMMARHGWRLDDSWPTWVKPLAARAGRALPRPLRDALLALELPLAPLYVRLSDALPKRAPKEHRFFVYRRPPAR
jgi:SAM-dependent methyltransferase